MSVDNPKVSKLGRFAISGLVGAVVPLLTFYGLLSQRTGCESTYFLLETSPETQGDTLCSLALNPPSVPIFVALGVIIALTIFVILTVSSLRGRARRTHVVPVTE